MTPESRVVLDTSVVIADDVIPAPGIVAISMATLAELHFGVLVVRTDAVRAKRLRRLSVIQRQFTPLPIDEAVAESYGQIAAAVAKAGRQPRSRTMDLIVAATAHTHSAILYTRNPKDFQGLAELVEVHAV